ncbi:MAG TPA: hypothetical protein VFG42_09725 [Baekduia sp.]|uniref:hypothetical protein n=1 Tax=Baekduia sp. TaxID=2600305 RepID=UPI002D7799AD|nr:hypothetical protein [Baekduia sp.]HET6507058.1 hypothetical protein [Baekduia sp.]
MLPRPALPAALLLAFSALALVFAGPAVREAHAGTYVVYSCQDPNGNLASTSSWSFRFSAPTVDTHDDTCPRGGVHVRLTPGMTHPADAEARMYFWAPDNTVITKYTLWRSARVAAGTAYFFSAMEKFGTTGDDYRWAGTGCKGTTNNCSGVGDPATPLSDANKFSRTPPVPVNGVALYVSCGEPNSGTTACPSTSGVAAETWLHRADITLADDIKPSFSTAPAGGLVDATAPVSGISTVSVLATDKGGGVAQAMVEVDGKVVATQAFGGANCTQPYAYRVPCPLTASGTLSLDTATLADGAHKVRVLIQDAGGNTTAWGPVSLTTHNAPPDESCNPEPALDLTTAGMSMKPGLLRPGKASKGVGTAAITIHYATKAKAKARGLLRAADGTPLGGQPVCLVWRPAGTTGPLEVLRRVTTKADGRFSIMIPRGSSREIYAIHRTPAGAVVGRTVLRVIPKVTIAASRRSLRNGQLLTLRGRLSGGPIPSRGVLVRAEAWRGTHWQPFRDTRAKGSKGSFRVRYRFVGTTGSQRYTLRFHVVAQAAYPYVGGVSKRIHVRVRG